ncbi:hypothetical protein Acid345_3181 [Candidatus Koribacter versatilis Ellin345]|uniref:Uncharacterized protein n=1 Tax=Koribacter versatilis (strain Ellin345) TaxID=204669 RepID=Q1ILR8_KORVE|nr:MarR family transcriptional regulator [Candidatus Koribacter versatilis]ABF42182.1 hypothetical protein Acid345_3181 [Candidatus Koribacter versatilis Ellin345]
MALVTQKSIARRFGVTPQYVNKLVTQGHIEKHGRQVDERQAVRAMKAAGRVEISAKAQAKKAAAKKPAKNAATKAAKPKEAKPPKAQSATGTQAHWKAKELEFKAKNQQLEYEKNAGMWLPVAGVRDAEQKKNANIKEKFRQLPRALAQRLARLTVPAEVEQVLRDEIDLVFAQLAADPLGMAEAISAAPQPAEFHDPHLVPPPAPQVQGMEAAL